MYEHHHQGPEREGVQDWEKIQHSEPRGPVQLEVPVDEEILHAAAYRPAGGGIDQETRVPLEVRVGPHGPFFDICAA